MMNEYALPNNSTSTYFVQSDMHVGRLSSNLLSISLYSEQQTRGFARERTVAVSNVSNVLPIVNAIHHLFWPPPRAIHQRRPFVRHIYAGVVTLSLVLLNLSRTKQKSENKVVPNVNQLHHPRTAKILPCNNNNNVTKRFQKTRTSC